MMRSKIVVADFLREMESRYNSNGHDKIVISLEKHELIVYKIKQLVNEDDVWEELEKYDIK